MNSWNGPGSLLHTMENQELATVEGFYIGSSDIDGITRVILYTEYGVTSAKVPKAVIDGLKGLERCYMIKLSVKLDGKIHTYMDEDYYLKDGIIS